MVFFDDLVLSIQRVMDRLIRRLRRGAAPEVTQRRLLIVQIDGLSHSVLTRALASRAMPFLAHLMERHGYALCRAPSAPGVQQQDGNSPA